MIEDLYLNKLIKMMHSRGYYDSFTETGNFYHISEDKCIYNTILKKVTTSFIREIIPKLMEFKYTYCIIVYELDVTSNIKEISEKIKSDIYFDLWSTSELLIDIADHKFQPKFSLLTLAESKQIIRQYGVMLPVLKKSDQLCKYFNWKPGSIIKFERNEETSYRIVRE